MTGRKMMLTTQGDRELLLTRGFDAPRRLVFDAYTRPELVRRWMLGPPGWEMPSCEIDLRVGGGFRYVWRNHDGREMGVSGKYHEIDAPARIVHTERFDDDWTAGDALITNIFTDAEGHTMLAGTIRYASPEAREKVLGFNMADGMAAGFDRLDELLAELAAS